MKLGREESVRGLQREYAGFAELIRSLDDDQWRTTTRCEGWEVRDVAGHVTGIVADLVSGGGALRTSQEQADAMRGRAPREVADELDGLVASFDPLLDSLTDEMWEGPSLVPDISMRQGVLTLWYDTWVHADDIRAALGQPTERGPGLRASVLYLREHLEERGWGPASVELDGIEKLRIGVGNGTTVTGDPHLFVLAATGRMDPGEIGLDDKVNIYA